MDISVVIPLYNEDESLPELTAWIERVMAANHFTYEIIMVDDGSSDNSWALIETLSTQNKHIRAMVSGWKKKRFDPKSKTIPTKLFNATARKFSGIHLHDFNCGLKAYKNKVVKSIEVYGEMHRYIPILAQQAGFTKIGEKVVQHRARKYGVTKFGGLNRFINGMLDLLSITFITRFAKKPMHLFGAIGTLLFIIGFCAAGWIGIDKLICLSQGIRARLVTDNPYFYISLVCMILGTQLFLAGFVAELVSRSATDRNVYLIEKEI